MEFCPLAQSGRPTPGKVLLQDSTLVYIGWCTIARYIFMFMETIIMFKGQLWSGFAVSVAIYSGLSLVLAGSANALPCIRVVDPATGKETCVTPFTAWPKEGLGACGFRCVKHLDGREFIKVYRLFDRKTRRKPLPSGMGISRWWL